MRKNSTSGPISATSPTTSRPRKVRLRRGAAIDETRARHVFTDPRTGTISLYQIGDWLTSHVIRHNAQLKVLLGR